jgi:hypothetical protein
MNDNVANLYLRGLSLFPPLRSADGAPRPVTLPEVAESWR